MHDKATRYLIAHQRELAWLVHEFNILPSRYIHRSWLDEPMGEYVAKTIATSKRAERHLSAWIIADLNHEFHYHFDDRCGRLALLDRAGLQKLMIYAGAAINADHIARLIEGQKIVGLKRKLGEELYRFAIKRAPLLIGRNKAFSFRERSVRDDLAAQIVACGISSIEVCLCGQPEALLQRFMRKFAKTMAWNFSITVSPEEKKAVWQLLRKIILQEVDVKWEPILS